MKIQATLRQVNDAFPYFKQLVNENIAFEVGYKLYVLSEKLDKVLGYLRDRATKELAGLSDEETKQKVDEILETKIEIDAEPIDREKFFKALPENIALPPIAFSMLSFALTPEVPSDEEAFKVI